MGGYQCTRSSLSSQRPLYGHERSQALIAGTFFAHSREARGGQAKSLYPSNKTRGSLSHSVKNFSYQITEPPTILPSGNLVALIRLSECSLMQRCGIRLCMGTTTGERVHNRYANSIPSAWHSPLGRNTTRRVKVPIAVPIATSALSS